MPEGIRQEYIPPTYGQLFQDTYLKTHRQRMQTSLALAQQELQTEQSLLSYYAKKEKEYLSYIEGVGTAGTSGGKGTKSKAFDRKLAVIKLEKSMKENEADSLLKIEKMVEDEFGVPVGANVGLTARQAANNLGASLSNTLTAIRGLKGFKPGTASARVTAVALYNQMEAEAVATGNAQPFNTNKNAIRKAIADHVGVPEAEQDMVAPNRLEAAKSARKNQLVSDIAGKTVSNADLRSLRNLAGIADPTTTTAGKGPSATALEQEELMASRLTGIQRKMSALEQSILDKSSAEQMMARSKEIYRNEFSGGRGKGSRQARKFMKNLTPEQRYLVDSIKAGQASTFNPQNYVPSADGADAASVEAMSYELMNTIIGNRGSGKVIDVAAMAAKMDPKNSQKLLGLALKGAIAYMRTADPLTETKEKIAAEVNVDAIEGAMEDVNAQIDTEKQELTALKRMENAPVDTTADAPGEYIPFADAKPAFPGGEAEAEAFMANRIGLSPQRVGELLNPQFDVTPEEINRISAMSQPGMPPQSEPITALPIGTKVKKDPTFSYSYQVERIAPNGQIQFSVSTGAKMLPAMQKEAELAYEKALKEAQTAQ